MEQSVQSISIGGNIKRKSVIVYSSQGTQCWINGTKLIISLVDRSINKRTRVYFSFEDSNNCTFEGLEITDLSKLFDRFT